MGEGEYLEFVGSLPFGRKYLLPRREVSAPSAGPLAPGARPAGRKPAREKKPTARPLEPSPREVEELVKTVPPSSKREEAEAVRVPSEGKGGRQHRYLQSLVKRMAEENGYRAIIEKPTPDGAGQVDVSLERDEYQIACEISVTSTDQQELANIAKCLAAGYDKVILCSPKKRSLQRVKKLVAEKLEEADQGRVLFLEPEELFFYLGEETGDEVGGEQRVKGYKVKVRHQPVKEAEERAKREAVAQVIVQALRRLRDEK